MPSLTPGVHATGCSGRFQPGHLQGHELQDLGADQARCVADRGRAAAGHLAAHDVSSVRLLRELLHPLATAAHEHGATVPGTYTEARGRTAPQRPLLPARLHEHVGRLAVPSIDHGHGIGCARLDGGEYAPVPGGQDLVVCHAFTSGLRALVERMRSPCICGHPPRLSAHPGGRGRTSVLVILARYARTPCTDACICGARSYTII